MPVWRNVPQKVGQNAGLETRMTDFLEIHAFNVGKTSAPTHRLTDILKSHTLNSVSRSAFHSV